MNVKRIARILENEDTLLINEVVLNQAQKKNQIIYGARAINRQLPTYLKKKTSDYDVLTKKPKKVAKETALELNRRLGRDEYVVTEALHKGTYRVKDSAGKTIIDYTQIKKRPKTKSSFGNDFKDIDSIERDIKSSINKKENEFRKEKDNDSLDRIKQSKNHFFK